MSGFDDEQVEALADYAHGAWSEWMSFLFANSDKRVRGDVIIPVHLVRRWEKQMRTQYKDLSESEKESDRQQARRILLILDDLEVGKYHKERGK